MKSMDAQRWCVIGWLLALSVIVGLLELACRAGWLPNEAARLRALAAQGQGHRRVLILGDSFSVEDPTPGSLTLGNQLRTYCTARGIGVVNLAMSGYGPQDALDRLTLFRHYTGDTYRPDVVLFNYYVGNDLTDEIFRLHGGELRVLLPGAGWWSHAFLVRWWRERNERRHLQRQAERLRADIAAGRHPLVRTPLQLPDPPPHGPPTAAMLAARRKAVNPFLVTAVEHFPWFLRDNLLVESPLAREAWAGNEEVWRAMHRYAHAHGARFLIAIIPSTLQVNDSHYAFFADLGCDMDRRYLTSTAPQDRLRRFCAAEGVTCTDLLPLFKRHPEAEHYVEYDDHWRLSGPTLAAQGIEAALADGW